MDPDELFVLFAAGAVAVYLLIRYSFMRMPGLYFRDAAGVGLVRLAVVFALVWVVYVLYFHADPSVVSIYRLLYIVLGLAVVLWFGVFGGRVTGVRYREDVAERHNRYAAIVLAAFVVGTGLIFGGSNWGEADPGGEEEGGWWIPMGFFLAGWFGLCIATGLYTWRDTAGLRRRMRQRRRAAEARGLALYILASAAVLTDAVAGDFYGWSHGLLAVGAIAGMLISHEVIGAVAARGGRAESPPTGLESLLHVGWATGFWVASWLFFTPAGGA